MPSQLNTNYQFTYNVTKSGDNVGDARYIFNKLPSVLTNSSAGDDGVNVAFSSQQGTFTNDGTYWDIVCGFGVNITPTFGKVKATMPAASMRIESKYSQGATGIFTTEYHWSSFLADTSQEIRPITAVVPYNSTNLANANFSVGTRSALFSISDHDNVQALLGNFIGATNDWSWASSIHYFDRKSNPLFKQLNAAGSTFLDLPYYDADNTLTLPATIRGSGPSTRIFELNATASISVYQVSGLTANGFVASFVNTTAVTGALTGLNLSGNASTAIVNKFTNVGAGRNGNSIFGNDIMFSTMSDTTRARHVSFTYYPTGNGGNGAYVLDNSNQGGQFANKKSFTVNLDTWQTVFNVGPQIPPATLAELAALPANAKAAGTLYWCTNATGGAKFVISNGTDFYIVPLGAIVS